MLLRAAASYEAAVMLPLFSRVTVLLKGRRDTDANKTGTGEAQKNELERTSKNLSTIKCEQGV